MFSPQTRQALRVLRWRSADYLEDTARRIFGSQRPTPRTSGRPAPPTDAEWDALIKQHVAQPPRAQVQP